MIQHRLFAVAAALGLISVATSTLAAEYTADSKKSSAASNVSTGWTAAKAALAAEKKDSTAVAKQVDQLLAEDLSAGDGSTKVLQFGRRANDEVFLRRVYLDLIGRNPTPDEITAFVLDPSSDKRGKLIDRLLADPRFGENWARYWRDVIMYRRSDDRAQLAAPALFEYLRDQFQRNAPWNEIAASFITATGDVREKGETGLMMAQNGNTADITAEVSRIFLGVQIQCAQCHDHKTDRWKRTQFHELAAFFPRVAVRPLPNAQPRSFEVAGDDLPRFARQAPANPRRGNPEHYMPDLDNPSARGTKMNPVFFLTGQKLEPGQTDAQRRETVARWITATDNEWFAKAFVNRIWAELVGEGFYEPIDDLGPDRTCTSPKALDLLAAAFADSGYNIKRLYRTVVSTEAYQRESRSRRNANDTPFAANCPQRLRGDQLYDALAAALGIREDGPLGPGRLAQLRGPRAQVNQAFGYDPSMPRDEIVGSIPQALMLMNGPRINGAINGSRRDTELSKLLASTSDNEAVATELYLRSLGREPNMTELKTCLAHVKNAKSRAEGFEDIQWALVNSTEFLHRK